jgi:hypothetical protein
MMFVNCGTMVCTPLKTSRTAPLYFDEAELSAVLEVVEKVKNDSHTLETMNTDPGACLSLPAVGS